MSETIEISHCPTCGYFPTQFIAEGGGVRHQHLPKQAESEAPDERIYPCAKCGTMRSKAEGGTVFTVCDDCWDEKYGSESEAPDESGLRKQVVAANKGAQTNARVNQIQAEKLRDLTARLAEAEEKNKQYEADRLMLEDMFRVDDRLEPGYEAGWNAAISAAIEKFGRNAWIQEREQMLDDIIAAEEKNKRLTEERDRLNWERLEIARHHNEKCTCMTIL